uniref:Uncharacterized protein n=1 Tax=Rhizophora mucronata TaxID=61149 RepID=A0A2P2PSS7_RHIMU
MRYCVISNHQS